MASSSLAASPASDSETPLIQEKALKAAKPRPEAVGLYVDTGVYNAVLVSAFGGVKVELDGDKTIKLHPILIFIGCMPLFMIQSSAIIALRLDMKVEEGIIVDAGTSRLLLRLKLIMVLILQLMNFGYMLQGVRSIIFVLNPVTWLDVNHPKASSWLMGKAKEVHCLRFIGAPPFLAFVAFMALALRLFMGYLVCVDSVSVILSSGDVSDTIFNTLAISFISDLASYWWQLVEAVFHLVPMSKFDFTLNPKTWEPPNEDGDDPCEITKEEKESLACPEFIQGFVKRFPFFRHGHGYRKVETILTFAALFVIYTQQLFVVAEALDTNILPVARDVCTMWRWQHNKATTFRKTAFFVAKALRVLLLVPIADLTDEVVQDKLNNQCMPGQKYFRMVMSDRLYLMNKYPVVILGGIAAIISLLVVPQVISISHGRFIKHLQHELDEAEDEADLHTTVEMLKSNQEELRKELATLRKSLK